jgi:hypothetical protein
MDDGEGDDEVDDEIDGGLGKTCLMERGTDTLKGAGAMDRGG